MESKADEFRKELWWKRCRYEASQGNILRQNIFRRYKDLKNHVGRWFSNWLRNFQNLLELTITDEVLARTTGKILNPNAELLFQGACLRDFGFKFLMIARSEKDEN